ncbi:MAG: selenide, water dikinase SelD [Chlorobi bacterium]|nr:selenide, water dikinase SelD [Chlorobiota bacterium]
MDLKKVTINTPKKEGQPKFDLLEGIEYGGCSAKLPAKELDKALSGLPKVYCDNLLVDIDTHDDAGVYQINEDTALIQTTDFFPPVCSDPYEFGQIAAANALSDVFAMGGKVLTAMNLLMYPAYRPMEMLKEIIRGGQDKVDEAGGVLVGGHTLTDDLPKYGLAVTGVVHPDRIITNDAAKPGDVLIVTKPIGSGMIMSGKRLGEVGEEEHQAALDNMKILNKNGAEIMQKYGVRAATDVTGFGLAGHAMKMAQASGVTMILNSESVPLLKGAYDLADIGCIPGACFRNQEYVADNIMFEDDVIYEYQMLMLDAQTSGGLLICAPENEVDKMLKDLRNSGYPDSAVVGKVVEKEKKFIRITK